MQEGDAGFVGRMGWVGVSCSCVCPVGRMCGSIFVCIVASGSNLRCSVTRLGLLCSCIYTIFASWVRSRVTRNLLSQHRVNCLQCVADTIGGFEDNGEEG